MELIHGDCMQELRKIPDRSVNLIFADLPYGTTRNKWDSVLPLDELWKQYKRILAKEGCVLLFAQQPFLTTLINSNPRWFRYEWIWEKTNATGFLNCKKMPLKAHENIGVFYPKLPFYSPIMTKGRLHIRGNKGRSKTTNWGKYSEGDIGKISDEYYPRDVIRWPSPSSRNHPTEKPVGLCEYFIKTYSDRGGVVLDNTMGSGSIGVAAVNTGRDFIGIEMNDEYFNIAKQRIEQAERNQSND